MAVRAIAEAEGATVRVLEQGEGEGEGEYGECVGFGVANENPGRPRIACDEDGQC